MFFLIFSLPVHIHVTLYNQYTVIMSPDTLCVCVCVCVQRGVPQA